MNFYAIGSRFQENAFYDFAKKEICNGLNVTCLLPTKEMAQSYINEELSSDYIVADINLETLDSYGDWSYTRNYMKEWDGYAES